MSIVRKDEMDAILLVYSNPDSLLEVMDDIDEFIEYLREYHVALIDSISPQVEGNKYQSSINYDPKEKMSTLAAVIIAHLAGDLLDDKEDF